MKSEPDVNEIIAMVKKKNDPLNRAENIKTAIFKYSCVNDNEKSTIKIFLKTPGKIKIISQTKDEFWECGYDGKTAWEYTNDKGVRVLTGSQVDEIRLQAFLLAPSIKIKKVFKDIKIAGSAKVDGEDCWKLTCQPAEEFKSQPLTVFVTKKTSLIVKAIEEQDTDDGIVKVTSIFKDYRKYNDFLLPVKTITRVEDDSTESTLTGVMMNLDIPDSEFAPPQGFK
jgi:outer membrane lipoprotein-sorting protein